MTGRASIRTAEDLAAVEAALRCRCDRPCLLAAEDGPRCLKCGKPPALRPREDNRTYVRSQVGDLEHGHKDRLP